MRRSDKGLPGLEACATPYQAAWGPARPSSTTNRASVDAPLSARNGSSTTRKVVVQRVGVMSARP